PPADDASTPVVCSGSCATSAGPPKIGVTGARRSSSFVGMVPAVLSRSGGTTLCQLVVGGCFRGRSAADAELLLDLRLDRQCDVDVLDQEVPGVLLALTELDRKSVV